MSIKLPEKRPETGWGEHLAAHFNNQVTVHNRAINGRSSKSFYDQGHWQKIVDELQPGDFVLIQFGHNDEKEDDPLRFTNPYTTYRDNLANFVADVRSKNATPILLSSIVRRNFNEQGTLIDTHGAYPYVVKQLAVELNAAFIDMTTLSERLVAELGPEKSKAFYLHLAPGDTKNYPEGKEDDTHLRPEGAEKIAKIVVRQLCSMDLAIRDYLKDCAK